MSPLTVQDLLVDLDAVQRASGGDIPVLLGCGDRVNAEWGSGNGEWGILRHSPFAIHHSSCYGTAALVARLERYRDRGQWPEPDWPPRANKEEA
jgi:hypothetical protein